jgi:glycosyltransferase involved in cell wall biosynthesis
VVFVGGFEHPPNVDAATRLVRGVMPGVWREHGSVPVRIVGASPPEEVLELGDDLVEVTGWVKDVDTILDQARVMVAPLSYGAGLKGKVTQALASGLPVVTTPIGAEGLGAADGEHLLIGSDDDDLADRVMKVIADDDLWERLSAAGLGLAAEQWSPQTMRDRLRELRDQLQVSADVDSERGSNSGAPTEAPASSAEPVVHD